MQRSTHVLAVIAIEVLAITCLAAGSQADKDKDKKKDKDNFVSKEERQAAIRRAQVWIPTVIPSMDLRKGPSGPGSFAPDELVACDYVEKKMNGNSPKFTCRLADQDEVKVKFGRDNGEVYAEVATTRLLWALGFGADRMYPVQRRVPRVSAGFSRRASQRQHDRVGRASQHRAQDAGHAIETHEDSGWAWPELDLVSEQAGGAPRAQVDALQTARLAPAAHRLQARPAASALPSDGKPRREGRAACAEPLMMLNDVGLTFGHANSFNRNGPGSTNFEEWSHTPVWKVVGVRRRTSRSR